MPVKINNHADEVFSKIDDALQSAKKSGNLNDVFSVAKEIVSMLGVVSATPTLRQFKQLKAHPGWVKNAPEFADRKASYALETEKDYGIDFKLFWAQKPSKKVIANLVTLTPNFEDEKIYANKNVGIDFVVSDKADKLIIVLSNNYKIRTLELDGKLSNTQKTIFNHWLQSFDFTNKAQVHHILWDSFDIRPLNKEFYKEISRFFTELLQHLENKNILAGDHRRQFATRLIGRLIFCWFLRKKGIISEQYGYFDASSTDATNYYHSKLELLFFRTLNTPMDEREKNADKIDATLFGKKEGAKTLFPTDAKTPFLNGGLFEPKDSDLNGDPLLTFPADFFQRFYAFLNGYHFTTDESTSDFQQVAIDPEMLGRIFENLLAEITDETGKQARKAKGAFYTPREIVEYMCKESLRAFLSEKLGEDERKEKLLSLLLDKKEHEFDSKNDRRDIAPYKAKLVSALDEMKILDPACGSGAFPIGMMQLISTVYDRIESRFDSYKTKLGIIEKNIFGVDIEPMAVEISRLRAWLSLVVDEPILPDRQNMGIDPLPNLEFKFVCANSLIPLAPNGQTSIWDHDKLEEKMRTIRDRYFTSSSRNIKEKMKQDFADLLKGNGKGSIIKTKKSKRQEQLLSYDPFNSDSSAEFFDPLFMFGIKEGFDVVIGNPPYGFRNVLTSEQKTYYRKIENIEFSSGDSAELFCKKSFNNLVRPNGILTFIIPKKSLYGDAWDGFRKEYWLKYNLRFLLDSSKAFDEVLLEANAFGLVKNSSNDKVRCSYLNKNDVVFEFASGHKAEIFAENGTAQIYKLLISKTLWQKIQDAKTNEHLVKGRLGLAIGTDFFSDKQTDYKLLKGIDIARWKIKSNRWLKNKSKLNWDSAKKFLKPKVIAQVLVAHIDNPKPHIKLTACYDAEGIIITNTLMSFALDDKLSSKFWLSYLNSSFVNWYAYNFIYARAIRTMHLYDFYIQQIPIPQAVLENNIQLDFIALEDNIQKVIQSNDYLVNAEKQAKIQDFERQIDALVYSLYDLTNEEIKIVEGNEKVNI
ncbi:MAG: TaqI-like C-terminal specificity domain-containing protein [bacterium]|nr:TaqI-like C-terminal specificity domain-containing protein [bacterium]